jgi:hypothetical protein
VQEHPAQFRFALPAGTLEPVVILFTAFEGAVDEDELPLLWQCLRRLSSGCRISVIGGLGHGGSR